MKKFFVLNSDNFVPVTRTPWGGKAISIRKKRYLNDSNVPERIGESWEVSTDTQFPSVLTNDPKTTLTDLLAADGRRILGAETFDTFGSHCPLLLKWLHAQDVLSVQLHPQDANPALKTNECGKPEAWLILEATPGSYVYLGFQENVSQVEIHRALSDGNPEKCLHKYYPKTNDYISVPPGCVHAVGPGVLLAEPQSSLPGKSGKTWRLSDWGRRYDANGNLSPQGELRELHLKEGWHAIDWSLPRGAAIEKVLVRSLDHQSRFEGDAYSPFATQVYLESGQFRHTPLAAGAFSLITVWAGQAQIANAQSDEVTLVGGQSCVVAADAGELFLTLESLHGEKPSLAFFALGTQ